MFNDIQHTLLTLALAFERGRAGTSAGSREELATPGYDDMWTLGERSSRGERIDMMMIADAMAAGVETVLKRKGR
jgi:hypothetical protein